ncbi:hypothetical protein Y1Q_0010395 [Alligator mississippiensis]|uniref:Uncharacterized protein n=1 Tax=Alligator mississippiensis TaxID=8496 RepID=A0A151MPF6_ALLMI|nr:hypothetical protein Y1Q_0010395 [Alligator mississippiensis]
MRLNFTCKAVPRCCEPVCFGNCTVEQVYGYKRRLPEQPGSKQTGAANSAVCKQFIRTRGGRGRGREARHQILFQEGGSDPQGPNVHGAWATDPQSPDAAAR